MKQLVHIVRDTESLDIYLKSEEVQLATFGTSSILAQVYSMPNTTVLALDVAEIIRKNFPLAVVVGASTVGEVASGKTTTGATLVVLNCFDRTTLAPFALECADGGVLEKGQLLGQSIRQSVEDITAVLLLATPLSVDVNLLLSGIGKTIGECLVFGGGAGDYAAMKYSWVLVGDRLLEKGLVAVALAGRDLHVETRTSLGWRALSKEMTITAVDGLTVTSIDNQPALDVYRRYIETHTDEDFALTASEFPFLIERYHQTLARVPIDADETGALHFMADIAVGDRFRIGYGDPAKMIDHARDIHESMEDFAPQGVFLFTCGCRRYLLQDDVNLETYPFEATASTAGFYTYGEFYGRGSELGLLNATLLALGLREGPPAIKNAVKPHITALDSTASGLKDPYARQHVKVVSSLVRFIGTVTEELERANQELELLSVTDRLTRLYNRARIEAVLEKERDRVRRYGESLSVIMLDIDYFKCVNDEHGHDVGDAVLVTLAKVLQKNLRSSDTVGRWGGEEFMMVLPKTSLTKAMEVAEKVRAAVATAVFPVVIHKTASLGVASYLPTETVAQMLVRADTALYAAKHGGRNRVESAEQALEKKVA